MASSELPDHDSASLKLDQALGNCGQHLALLQGEIAQALSGEDMEKLSDISQILVWQPELVKLCQESILGRLPTAALRLGVELNKQINLLSIDGQQLKIARQVNTQKLRLQQMQNRLKLIREYIGQLQVQL
ncbi:MAG: hypothetical protein WCO45_06765 [Pseudanabaena sp. ELA607]